MSAVEQMKTPICPRLQIGRHSADATKGRRPPMSDQNRTRPDDDTEGHATKFGGADGEAPEGNDTEGHKVARADAETAESDDTEGHVRRIADAETPEGEDTEGHGYRCP
jgi:hypothetical protein